MKRHMLILCNYSARIRTRVWFESQGSRRSHSCKLDVRLGRKSVLKQQFDFKEIHKLHTVNSSVCRSTSINFCAWKIVFLKCMLRNLLHSLQCIYSVTIVVALIYFQTCRSALHWGAPLNHK